MTSSESSTCFRIVDDKIMCGDFVFGIFPDRRIAESLLALLNKPVIGEIIALQSKVDADLQSRIQYYAMQPHTEDNLKMLAAFTLKALCR